MLALNDHISACYIGNGQEHHQLMNQRIQLAANGAPARCESNPNTSVGTGSSSPHPRMYLLKSGIFKFISFSVTCNVEGAVWQPWKLSPLFLHRTGIARAAAMQASPHCPANAPQPSSEEVTSGGEWVEESLCVQRLLQGSGSCRMGCGWRLAPVLSEPPVLNRWSLHVS